MISCPTRTKNLELYLKYMVVHRAYFYLLLSCRSCSRKEKTSNLFHFDIPFKLKREDGWTEICLGLLKVIRLTLVILETFLKKFMYDFFTDSCFGVLIWKVNEVVSTILFDVSIRIPKKNIRKLKWNFGT